MPIYPRPFTDENFYLPNVSQHERDFMRTLVESVADEIRMDREDIYTDEVKLDIVSGVPLDGFFPYTLGGFEAVLCATLGYAYGSGAIPACIQPYVDGTLEEIEKDFCEKHSLKELVPDELTEEQQKQFWEMEHRALYDYDSTYFYKVRSWKDKNGSIFFDSYINTDFGYGRDYVSYAGGDKTHGQYKRRFHISENLTDDQVKRICEQVAREVISYVGTL